MIERECLGGNRKAEFEADLERAQQLGTLEAATRTDPVTHVPMVPLLVARRVTRATAPSRRTPSVCCARLWPCP